MSNITEIIAELESRWEATCVDTIKAVVVDSPDDRFYGAGFWCFYADYTVLGTPCFAMNTEANLADDSDSNRWLPPNWRFDNISQAADAMDAVYQHLGEALDGQSDETWKETIEAHKQAIARVCHKLTAAANSDSGPLAGLAVSTPFVVGIFEEQDGDEEYDRLALLSVEESLIEEVEIPIE